METGFSPPQPHPKTAKKPIKIDGLFHFVSTTSTQAADTIRLPSTRGLSIGGHPVGQAA